jgi:hypothetical protein
MPRSKAPPELQGQRTISSANVNPENPRKITDIELEKLSDSLKRFGDLSGIVLNRTTRQLVGGHQRISAFKQSEVPVTLTEELPKPDRTGTIAYGFIELNGTRYGYREVVWTKAQERVANIAANKLGGDWDNQLLAAALTSIKELPNGELEQTGFNDADLSRLLAGLEKTPAGGERGPKASDDDYSLFELIMQHDNKQRFVALLDRIRQNNDLKTLEESIMWLVDKYEGEKE